MAYHTRVSYDPGEENHPALTVAGFSTLDKEPRRRGRKRAIAVDGEENTHIPAQPRFDEHLPMPSYPGDATEEQIQENILQYEYHHTKLQNDYLHDWILWRIPQLTALLEMEAPNNPNLAGKCENCCTAGGMWRCRACTGRRMLCPNCLWDTHCFLPYHRVEKWNGTYFRDGALWEVGVQLHLGHKGKLCPGKTLAAPNNILTPTAAPPNSSADDTFEEEPGDPELPDKELAGDIEEDDLVFEEPEIIPGTGVTVPSKDTYGNNFVCVVDVTGIHYLPVVTCACPNTAADGQLAYIRLGLFPASFVNVRTVFTEAVLHDFRLTNLECKSSAYQYYQKLRRLTSPAFPKSVINRYRELQRLSRQYRNLKLWKIHGKIYDKCVDEDAAVADLGVGQPSEHNSHGTLALFCAACPQPGINLPPNWKDEPDKNLYTRSLVADGNFKADQLNLRNQDDDVALTNGEAFMTAGVPYQAHLAEATKLAPRYKTKPTCHNHHATADADKAALGKCVQGIGAHACTRHGCFCPGSVIDFTKGEKQMHMDWSLVQAIATTHMDELVRLLHIYDVNCQYAIKLLLRIAENHHLHIPALLKIISAIGMFHVHGHKDDCLYRYGTVYVPGVGMIDGEVLETLWAVLNLTSPSTCGATIAHRTEVLDNHMGDSNWKKIINTYVSIGKRYTRAIHEEPETLWYLEDIEAKIPEHFLLDWETEASAAEETREHDPTAMDFMRSKIEKGKTRREIEADLGTEELKNRAGTGTAAWLATGISLQFEQLQLRCVVRKYGTNPTTAQCLDLLKRRRRLRKSVQQFITTTADFLDAESLHELNKDESIITDTDIGEDEVPDVSFTNLNHADLERQKIPFPSLLLNEFINTLPPIAQGKVLSICQVELELRCGQATDCLEGVRNNLIQLSWQYRNEVRVNKTQATRTRAWNGAKLLIEHCQLQRQFYNLNRFALTAAANNQQVAQLAVQFPFLKPEDCRTSDAITAPNAHGHTRARLNWLWHDTQPMDENLEQNNYAVEFWCINWLKARAIHNRWVEEKKLTEKEMDWTVLYYVHMAKKWMGHAEESPPPSEGHVAYAAKKAKMWTDLGSVAQAHFEKLQRR